MTPEGKTKAKIKKLLNSYGAYSYMPVSNGMGAPSLDYLCCINEKFFAVEAKAWDSNKDMTLRQKLTAKEMMLAGATVFMVRDAASLTCLEYWIKDAAAEVLDI